MKIFTLLFALFFTAATAFSQAVLVNSPAGVAGYYQFDAAGFGADLLSDVWTGDAILANDGSADPAFGCGELVNPTDVAGKIVLVDRGACEFGLKSLNAQTAGAIGVIVFNNTAGAGTIVMGGGAVGDQVTIPAVMLSYEDGQALKAALSGGAVNITIGNIQIPNDIATSTELILLPRYGVIPAYDVTAAGDFPINPGLLVLNNGLNTANNVTASATITHTPPGGSGSVVYDQSVNIGTLASGDTSALVTYPVYDPFNAGTGLFNLNYNIDMDADDDKPGDNEFNVPITISDNVYSKASWDHVNNRPNITIGYTIAGGGPIEFMTGFEIKNGVGKQVDSMYFYISVATGLQVGDQAVTALIYMWNDDNEDDVLQPGELSIVALAIVENYPDPTATNAHMKVEILDFNTFEPGWEVPSDNIKLFAGIRYQEANMVFFGFDENMEYRLNENTAGLSDVDLPYIGANQWDGSNPSALFLFGNTRAASSIALVVSDLEVSTANLEEINAEITLFPNPANEKLNVDLKFNEVATMVEFRIFSATGQLISSYTAENVLQGNTNFDVSQLPAGLYYLNIRTDEGATTRSFNVMR